jgi:SAM-dependent methyltransferase
VQAEVAAVEQSLRDHISGGEVLELACGTGLWTRLLAQVNHRVMAVDAAPEVIDVNRSRTQSAHVHYLVADLFLWTPPLAQFDAVFFGCWLSHVRSVSMQNLQPRQLLGARSDSLGTDRLIIGLEGRWSRCRAGALERWASRPGSDQHC